MERWKRAVIYLVYYAIFISILIIAIVIGNPDLGYNISLFLIFSSAIVIGIELAVDKPKVKK